MYRHIFFFKKRMLPYDPHLNSGRVGQARPANPTQVRKKYGKTSGKFACTSDFVRDKQRKLISFFLIFSYFPSKEELHTGSAVFQIRITMVYG